MNPMIQACDEYLGERTGCYAYRRIRYSAALDEIRWLGLEDSMTIYDIGAGMTEFDYCLRKDYDFRGRYIPVDGGIDGTDLDKRTPPRPADYFVALELLEHLNDPDSLVRQMKRNARKGIVISTPNPHTTDVLGMDRTHKTPIWPYMLRKWNFKRVMTRSFYGKSEDSLFGVWYP